MPGVSAEQVRLAREVDLLSYLQKNEPQELQPPKNGEYRTVSHGSLVISKGKWIWNRGGIGGRTAPDYLIKVRGMDFVSAVETVLGSRAAPVSFSLPGENQKPPTEKWTFYPPKPLRYPSRAVAYLQRRGISPEVINRAIQAGILYESNYYNPTSAYHNAAVCVFAGKDESGRIVFAALRGIDTDLKMDKAGSDKRYNFTLPAIYPGSRELAVFEAPVDLLSHATLALRGDLEFEGHRLSLGGTSDVALMAYLERNVNIGYISLCLDNDDAGWEAAAKIYKNLGSDARYSDIAVTIDWPEEAKDYNDTLLRVINMEREHKQSNRRQADILF